MDNSIVILGRGMSLKRLSEFKNNIDTIILVNSFFSTKESKHCTNPKKYCDDSLIHNFIKDKKIYMVMSPKQYINKDELNYFLNKYNVLDCYFNIFSKGTRKGKPKGIFKILPDSLLEDTHIAFNSLDYAIIWSIKELKCKNIFVFGKDFYEKGYYIKQSGTNKYEKSLKEHLSKEHVQRGKNNFIKLLKFYPNITFNLYSLANFNPNLKNVNIF